MPTLWIWYGWQKVQGEFCFCEWKFLFPHYHLFFKTIYTFFNYAFYLEYLTFLSEVSWNQFEEMKTLEIQYWQCQVTLSFFLWKWQTWYCLYCITLFFYKKNLIRWQYLQYDWMETIEWSDSVMTHSWNVNLYLHH